MLFKSCVKSRHFTVAPMLGAAFVVAGLAFPVNVAGAQDAVAAGPPEKEVSQLLEQSQAAARKLARDASLLESFTRGNLSWESHAAQLQAIKDHINTMGADAKRLQELHPAAAPWQQHAIDRIIPLMVEMASLTQTAIEHVNANRDRLHTPEYTQYLKDKAEVSANLSGLITDFVVYGQAKAKLAELEKSLGVAGS